MGPFLVSEEFGELLLCRPLRPVGLVDVLCDAVFVAVFVPLFVPVRPVTPIAMVANWSVGADPAPCIIESFTGGLYWLSPSVIAE